jgi:hypothetical protein
VVGTQFTSVWASKRHATKSSDAVAQALTVADPGGEYSFRCGLRYRLRCLRFSSSLLSCPGGLWANLWKPTIDALGAVLGRDDGAQEWNIRDGRITELGLHCTIDPDRGHDVEIAVRASMATA